MSSRCPDLAAVLLALALAFGAGGVRADDARALRVCADPDNLPYSNHAEAGFENRIARLVAEELQAALTYAWQPLGRGFVRKTLGAQLCDVFIGVPAGFERVLTTRPYYRSGYVFVNRADRADALLSFDDPRLPRLRIGVQLIGNDLAATPPGYALARHGAIDRVVGYTIMGDGPAAERIVYDLENGALMRPSCGARRPATSRSTARAGCASRRPPRRPIPTCRSSSRSRWASRRPTAPCGTSSTR